VTGSASGLDPHISVENADIQAQRVADARRISVDKVKALIPQYTEGPDLGILGDPGVNVLKLNIALDNAK
jgi:K+-transporting ATPase ATPase C chain